MSFHQSSLCYPGREWPAVNAQDQQWRNYLSQLLRCFDCRYQHQKGLVVPVIRNASRWRLVRSSRGCSVGHPRPRWQVVDWRNAGRHILHHQRSVFGSAWCRHRFWIRLSLPSWACCNIVERPVVNGQIDSSIMYLALSYDHRIVMVVNRWASLCVWKNCWKIEPTHFLAFNVARWASSDTGPFCFFWLLVPTRQKVR